MNPKQITVRIPFELVVQAINRKNVQIAITDFKSSNANNAVSLGWSYKLIQKRKP